jgi:hypothetical protein
MSKHILPAASPSVLVLFVANIVPLFGVLFGSWALSDVMFLYWFENVVIGWYTIVKMLRAEGPLKEGALTIGEHTPYTRKSRGFIVLFFILHYGIFTIVHGAFVSLIFGGTTMPLVEILFAALALMVSHGFSYWYNFIHQGEYKRIGEDQLFVGPYPRIIFLHMFIFIGGGLVMLLGAPLLALMAFVLCKTWFDSIAHTMSHALLQEK